jgi:threonine dehydratase
MRLADSIQKSTGAALVPPADHVDIVLGQGTAVSELLGQVAVMGRNPLDVIIVPSGGGGLLVGAAAVCRSQGVRLFGAEPECGGPGLTEALRNGMRPDSDAAPNKINTIADGLRSSTGVANWEHIKIQDNVEGVFTASERQIKEALRIAIETFGFIIEPSAAVPVAVVLFNTEFHRLIAKEEGKVKVGIVITGGNTSIDDVCEIIPGIKLNRGRSS